MELSLIISLSTQCQAAVIGAVTAPDFATCFPLADVLPGMSYNLASLCGNTDEQH
jgi:hypothetical protein